MKTIVQNDPWRVKQFVAAKLALPQMSGDGTAIGLMEDGDIIAGVIFDQFNGKSICMHVAAEPGKRWMTRDYLWFCFAYPFIQLKVSKIIGLVGEKNLPARRFDEHLGFVLETALTDAHPDGDLLLYSMRVDQCRWLNIRRDTSHHGKIFRSAAA